MVIAWGTIIVLVAMVVGATIKFHEPTLFAFFGLIAGYLFGPKKKSPTGGGRPRTTTTRARSTSTGDHPALPGSGPPVT